MRTQEEDEQRDEQTPRHHAAGKIERGQFRPDDVSHADIGRADGGRGERGDTARAEHLLGAQRAQPQRALAQLADAEEEIAVGRENVDHAAQVNQRAEAHVIEQILGGLGAALPGLVNFGCRHRFGKGQLRVFHHRAADEGNEKHAEHGAYQHQRGGFEIGRICGQRPHAGPESQVLRNHRRRPHVRQIKRRQSEHSARRHRFADSARGARDILFENASAAQSEHGHANHRRRISGRDGLAGAQAQVGVGRPQHHRHHQPQQQRAPGQLAHLHVFRHERPVLGGHHWRCDLTFSLRALPSTVLPARRACAAFITTPICLREVTPVSANAAATASSNSAAVAAAGR